MKTALIVFACIVAGCTSHPGAGMPNDLIDAAWLQAGKYYVGLPANSGGFVSGGSTIVSPVDDPPTPPPVDPCVLNPHLPGCMGTY